MRPTPPTDPNSQLLSEVARFQIKLWLEAARDLVLSPLTLVAAAIDLAFAKKQPPRYFRQLVTLGRRSDDWLDLWAAAKPPGARAENVDALLLQVEHVIRDPKAGGRRARALMRWADRNLRHSTTGVSVSPPPPPPPSASSPAAPE